MREFAERTVVIAPDSFKECLSSVEVCNIIADEIAGLHPGWRLVKCPLSDGGEGFSEVLSERLRAERVSVRVTGPLGESLEARYGRKGDTAIMDVASACGLQLVNPAERNPLLATTKGVGEMMLSAYKAGCRRFVIGLGGSATCDGGAGMMSVRGLQEIAGDIKIEALCDVVNPFIGTDGAARVFGPQKGATPAVVELLEERMRERAETILRETGTDVSLLPGAGAAGGIAGSLLAYFDAALLPGIDTFLDYVGFDELVGEAGLVISGEGRSDSQTLMGKAPFGVLRRTSAGVPVILISGTVEDRAALLGAGFSEAVQITPAGMSLAEAVKPCTAERNLRSAVKALF